MSKKTVGGNVFFIVSVFLMLISIPFVTIRDWFPFLRFGMFSVSPSSSLREPQFTILDTSGESLSYETVGFHAGHWTQLLRDYHYRNEHAVLLKAIHQSMHLSHDTLYFCGIAANSSSDTIRYASYPSP